MEEGEREFEVTVHELSVNLMRVDPPRPPDWRPSYSMRVPEDLTPGSILEVTTTSIVEVSAQIFKKEPDGSVTGPLVNPVPSSRLQFQFPVTVGGTYLLRLSQTELSSIVNAKVRMTISKPRSPGGDADPGGLAGKAVPAPGAAP